MLSGLAAQGTMEAVPTPREGLPHDWDTPREERPGRVPTAGPAKCQGRKGYLGLSPCDLPNPAYGSNSAHACLTASYRSTNTLTCIIYRGPKRAKMLNGYGER